MSKKLVCPHCGIYVKSTDKVCPLCSKTIKR